MAERAGTGWLFSLVGGGLMAIVGVFVVSLGFAGRAGFAPLPASPAAAEQSVNLGMVIAAAGLLVLFGSVAFYAMPDQRRNWAGLVIALSLLAWVTSAAFFDEDLAGLFLTVSIGPILGILGGALGLLWKTTD